MDLAAALPDVARWVEVRGMLLSGRGRLLHLDERGSLEAVIRQDDVGLAAIVGRPPRSRIVEGAAGARELLAVVEDAEWVARALPSWRAERATLNQLPPDAAVPPCPSEPVRELRPAELPGIPSLPAALRRELAIELQAGTAVTASVIGDTPVAFCYAGASTERLWDVAVATLEPYRRQGYATRCVTAQIHRHWADGKRPVWGAMERNVASQRLAEKLGFRPVDSIVVFSHPTDAEA